MRLSPYQRLVYVNGELYLTLWAGARKASEILRRKVTAIEILKILNGDMKFKNLEVLSWTAKQRRQKNSEKSPPREPLLRYPPGATPLNRGIPKHWR